MRNEITIDFKGKKLSFFFGLYFLGYFYDKYNSDVADVYDKLKTKPFSFIPLLMFESYLIDCERKDIKPKLTKIEFTDLVDENGGVSDEDGAAGKFLKVFLDSIIARLPKQDNGSSNDIKKK